MLFNFSFIAAFLLDALCGDPRWFPHPVRGIGYLITTSERLTRKLFANAYFAGSLTVFFVLSTTILFGWGLLELMQQIASWLEMITAVLLLYFCLALKDLLVHSNSVYHLLQNDGNIDKARKAVGMIVGRDTTRLDQKGIAKACIETVAENMVDGVTSPMFYGVLASCFAPLTGLSGISCAAIGALGYKAVNTMDSMIAYKSERYLQFGRTAAILDDIANFIPARLSGILVVAAAFVLRLDHKNGAYIFFRDKLAHASPNAGHTEAAVAGSLGLRLGGPSCYFDKIVEKPYLGDQNREISPEDIKRSHKLIVVGILLFMGIVLSTRQLLTVFL